MALGTGTSQGGAVAVRTAHAARRLAGPQERASARADSGHVFTQDDGAALDLRWFLGDELDSTIGTAGGSGAVLSPAPRTEHGCLLAPPNNECADHVLAHTWLSSSA